MTGLGPLAGSGAAPELTRRAVLAAAAATLATPARAGQPALRRGVSLSSWFANAPRQPLFERDFVQLAGAGFDHVRLPVDPELIGYRSAASPSLPRPDPDRARWGEVDAAVDLALRHGLAVIFDVHPSPEYQARLEVQPWVADELIAFLACVGRRYAGRPADRLAVEVLNEPQFYRAPDRYQRLLQRAVAALRAAMPRHALLVGGPFGNSIEGLQRLVPPDDGNLIYVFHTYLPYIVTHQGINQGFEGSAVRSFHFVPYPASLLDPARDYAPGAPDPALARRELQAYRDEDWNEARIGRELQPAADWAAAHGARVMCTEFGAYRAFIDPGSRYRWIGDMRRGLNRFGFGWSVYDYADIFGITAPVGETATNSVDHAVTLVDPRLGEHRLESAALAALGLQGA